MVIQKINQPFEQSWSCKSAAIAKVIACSSLPIRFGRIQLTQTTLKISPTFHLYHGFEKYLQSALIESIETSGK